MARLFEELAAFLAKGGGEFGLVLKAWGLVSLGDWLFDHPFALYVGLAVIAIGAVGAIGAANRS